jgi:hypothetical protein
MACRIGRFDLCSVRRAGWSSDRVRGWEETSGHGRATATASPHHERSVPMDPASDARRATTGTTGTVARGSRLRSVTIIVIFDVAAPLAAYNLLRSAGLTAVNALLLGGTFPALSVSVGAIRNRRLDVAGALVLTGIVVGTAAGLVSHSARLVLIDGSVPAGVFGAACLGSLSRQRPLMFSLALEFTGPDTANGREMTRLWQYDGYRRVLRTITAVWGVGFLVEAALRVVIVYNTSTGTALALSRVSPFVFAAILSAWTVAYGWLQRKKGGIEHAKHPA